MGPKFIDEKVRQFAVFCLKHLKNEELSLIMLQLVQALKYETYHYSPLAHFLLQRALFDVRFVGHSFFWYIQAELNNSEIADRFTLLVESFLRGAGANYRAEFINQMDFVKNLKNFARIMQQTPQIKRTEKLNSLLSSLTFPSSFILPSNPQFVFSFFFLFILLLLFNHADY